MHRKARKYLLTYLLLARSLARASNPISNDALLPRPRPYQQQPQHPQHQAVYSVLQEAEHRSVTPLPYWSLPFANLLVPRLRKFNVRERDAGGA